MTQDEYRLSVPGEIFKLALLTGSVIFLIWLFNTNDEAAKIFINGKPRSEMALYAAFTFGFVLYKAMLVSLKLLLKNPLLAIIGIPIAVILTIVIWAVCLMLFRLLPDKQLAEKLTEIVPIILTVGTGAVHILLLIGAIREN